MTPKQLAEKANISVQRVRELIRSDPPEIQATRLPCPDNQHGYRYDISETEAERFIKTPRKDKRGLPRGYKFQKESGKK